MDTVLGLQLHVTLILHFDVPLNLSDRLFELVTFYLLATLHLLVLLLQLFKIAAVEHFVFSQHRTQVKFEKSLQQVDVAIIHPRPQFNLLAAGIGVFAAKTVIV